MQTNILEYLEATVRRCPDKAALLSEDSSLSFRQLYDQARAIGSYLLHRGAAGQPVAVRMEKSPRTVAAFLGVLYAGCCYVPLDPELLKERLEAILEAVRPAAILCDADRQLPGGVLYSDAAFGVIDEEALRDVRLAQLDTDPAYVVFTSGSTGTPKGVIGTHRGVISYIEGLCRVLPFSEDTIFGSQTPLHVDACLKELIPTLKYGATTVLIPRKLFLFPIDLVKFLNEFKINTLCWVASAFAYVSSFRTFETIRPEYVRTVAFASEVFPIRQLNLWRGALPGARFFNLYGPTEATGICCCYEVRRTFREGETVPIGRPLPNTKILLLDREICILGSRLSPGYYREPELTERCFVTNPQNPLFPERMYRTGDLGSYNDKGELLFLGRRDQQVKHMGHRIELGDIEAAANAHPQLRGCCCLQAPDSGKLVLWYAGGADKRSLAQHLRPRLPRYMLPGDYRRLEALPLTPNGKVDRQKLKSLLGAEKKQTKPTDL